MSAHTQIRIVIRTTGAQRWNAEARHRLLLKLAWSVALVLLAGMIIYGLPYYRLAAAERAVSPYHAQLRPSGSIGIRLGVFGLGLFFLLFLYPLRKRWPWLSRIGQTKHWLDFHVLLGITAPIVITLHSSGKVSGLAGMAYWIMMAVAASGFVGRYLYAQIPRSMHSVDLTLQEVQAIIEQLAAQLKAQALLTPEEIVPLLRVPDREAVSRMSLLGALWTGLKLDLARPFQVSRVRRKFLPPSQILATLGGLLATSNAGLEAAISAVRTHSWMSARLLLLARTQQVFHMWHVVHRPFSLAFIVLVTVHIGVVLLFGFY